MSRLKAIGFLLIIAGAIIIFMSSVLPLIKLPQTFFKEGPSVTLDENTTYRIDTWILPPIDAGSPVSVDLEGAHPGGLTLAILPSQGGEVIPGSSPLLTEVIGPDRSRISATMAAPLSSEYIVFIVSIRNTFTLKISANWSPFYNLRVYLYFGIGVIPAGLLIVYYERLKESRERAIREALESDSR